MTSYKSNVPLPEGGIFFFLNATRPLDLCAIQRERLLPLCRNDARKKSKDEKKQAFCYSISQFH